MNNANYFAPASNSPTSSEFHAINSRILELSDELSAGCDPEFDAYREELEREFAELRLLTSTSN